MRWHELAGRYFARLLLGNKAKEKTYKKQWLDQAGLLVWKGDDLVKMLQVTHLRCHELAGRYFAQN